MTTSEPGGVAGLPSAASHINVGGVAGVWLLPARLTEFMSG